MCGVQFPMLLALVEFGFLLASMKFNLPKRPVSEVNVYNKGLDPEEKMKEKHKKADKICLAVCIVYFMLFNIIYWSYV